MDSGLCKWLKDGERGRNRTFNLLIKSQLLCQLSYAPEMILSGDSSPWKNGGDFLAQRFYYTSRHTGPLAGFPTLEASARSLRQSLHQDNLARDKQSAGFALSHRFPWHPARIANRRAPQFVNDENIIPIQHGF